MNKAEASIIAIKSSQLLMSKEQPSLIVDGKWGTFTSGVYERTSRSLRAVVDQTLAAAGTNATELHSQRIMQKAAGRQALSVGASTVEAIVLGAAAEGGFDPKLALKVAKIESGLNPAARNGSSKGLFQMQRAAWDEVRPSVPDLPPYDAGVFDARQNARAGIAYLKAVQRSARRLGFTDEFTAGTIYMAHQQGAAGMTELWKASTGRPVLTNYVKEVSMGGNAPQDGLGKARSKKEFFDRWVAYVNKSV